MGVGDGQHQELVRPGNGRLRVFEANQILRDKTQRRHGSRVINAKVSAPPETLWKGLIIEDTGVGGQVRQAARLIVMGLGCLKQWNGCMVTREIELMFNRLHCQECESGTNRGSLSPNFWV